MQKTFKIWNIVLFVLAMLCVVYYDYEGGLWLKGVTSGWFVVLGLVNLVYARKRRCGNFRFPVLVQLALFLTMAADVLLGIHFMTGVVVFALGHVCYYAAFCTLEKFRPRDLIPTVVFAVISLIAVLGTPFIRVEEDVMRYLLVAYAIVISLMVGRALGNLAHQKSRSRWLMAIGACLFWFSDLMLALNMFGSGGRLASLLCMYTYWPGQSILAHSLFHYVNEECR